MIGGMFRRAGGSWKETLSLWDGSLGVGEVYGKQKEPPNVGSCGGPRTLPIWKITLKMN